MKNKIVLIFLFSLFSIPLLFAQKVEDFFDIKKDDSYYKELEFLYKEGVFQPSEMLTLSSEVSKEDFTSFIQGLGFEKPYFCEDSTTECLDEYISIKKIIEVLLINTKLFSKQENDGLLFEIEIGMIDESLSKDVGVKNTDGTPNYYYGFLQKALSIKYSEPQATGGEKEYFFLKVDDKNYLNVDKNAQIKDIIVPFYIIKKLFPNLENEEYNNIIEDENKDTDGDGILDKYDKCPTLIGPESNKGCPILNQTCLIDSEKSGCANGYECGVSGFCEPKKVEQSTCIPKNGSSIFGEPLCNSCPCEYEINFAQKLRKCDIIIPAIVSPDGKTLYGKGPNYELPYDYK